MPLIFARDSIRENLIFSQDPEAQHRRSLNVVKFRIGDKWIEGCRVLDNKYIILDLIISLGNIGKTEDIELIKQARDALLNNYPYLDDFKRKRIEEITEEAIEKIRSRESK
jgi:hypothetical protein